MKQERLEKLLNEMSLSEKIGQLIQLSGDFFKSKDISFGPIQKLGIPDKLVDLSGSIMNVTGAAETQRLQKQQMAKQPHHIPVLFMSDVIYGFKTIFPIPVGLGATWNPELIKEAFKVAANEAAVSGNQVCFAPMVDVTHDPRWGRTLESPGEDPYLNSCFAKAMVEGLQEQLPNKKGQVACVKHYAAYGAVEAGLEYNLADMSMSNLFQNYLPPYKAAVKAGCKMVMASLNTLNGVPATANKWLLTDLLKKQWGFNGVIISDYASVYELIKHGFAADEEDAAFKALDAGIDIDMKSPVYANGLQKLVENGKLSITKINEACMRILQLKNDLGLFENPYFGSSEIEEHEYTLSDDNRKLARKVADEAIVLLKNNHQVLPLSSNEKVALIGPYGDEKSLIGMWAVHGDIKDCVTIKAALSSILGTNLGYAQGTDITRDKQMLAGLGFLNEERISRIVSDDETENQNHQAALSLAKKAETIILAVGENVFESGEAGSKTNLHLPKNQVKLIKDIHNLGKKIVLVVISGRPLVLTDVIQDVDAVVESWFPGTEGGNAIADVLFGKVSPSGRLSTTFPFTEGQEPLYYSHLSTGRPQKGSQHVGRFVSRYIDAPNEPLFPFGYGLSYADVKYSDLQIESDALNESDNLRLSIKLVNDSQWSQKETVQVYFHDDVASIVQPVKRLVSFKKVTVPAKTSVRVTFSIPATDFSFFDNTGHPKLEKGSFHLFIGPNSNDVITKEFQII
ncbi:beta-glucosidase BglX [Lactobacillus sp. ESL0679]|uniref:beta-glucosidase BglX n=1 Tax=Lactobacillus sp. ESL0679 TaxID=2983209 RepID=UPI0023F89478|nr:beta-glucosidase BglX [Lactobacillus sp. ESL0679]MDF7682980.1 beta-glucosidase BglX [Lactobacillus sp. ESL0679]